MSEAKKFKPDESEIDEELSKFLTWCQEVNISIDFSKVKISRKGSSHNYGMIAVADIQPDEILTRLPKSALLEPSTSAFQDVLAKSKKELKSKSNWTRLIIALMHELSHLSTSKWAPYLRLFPNYDHFDLPMFWTKEEFEKLLKHTCVHRNVEIDLENMRKEFDKKVLPFLLKHKDQFSQECFEFDYYKKVVGFIMAYSFRDPGEDPESINSVGPMMVPVGDILNHIAKNNAHLRFEEKELLICATKSIKKGEEVYNTYGEHSNSDLLHMYGFVEEYPENTFDSVEIPTRHLVKAIKEQKLNRQEVIEAKLNAMNEIDLIDQNTSFVIGLDGVLNEEESLHILQIFSMQEEEFAEFVENDYELLEDEEWDSYSLMNDKIAQLPRDWLLLFKDVCESYMSELKSFESSSVRAETEKQKQRVRSVQSLTDSHVKILDKFIESLKV